MNTEKTQTNSELSDFFVYLIASLIALFIILFWVFIYRKEIEILKWLVCGVGISPVTGLLTKDTEFKQKVGFVFFCMGLIGLMIGLINLMMGLIGIIVPEIFLFIGNAHIIWSIWHIFLTLILSARYWHTEKIKEIGELIRFSSNYAAYTLPFIYIITTVQLLYFSK